jgi:hypothetical protein
MKENRDNSDLPAGSDLSNSIPEMCEDQDNVESSENDFYILKSEDQNNLGEAMRLWESLRFMI